MRQNHRVLVITGAAGTGKTTVQKYLADHYAIPAIITHTTRPMRPGEQDGIDYYFEDKNSFSQLRLLEKVQYAGNYYGSSWEGIERALKTHQFASIVLDTAGAITYQRQLGNRVRILFLTVRNSDELQQRMLVRGDRLEDVKTRIQSSEVRRDFSLPDELQDHAKVIENENWQATTKQIDQIIKNLSTD